MSYTALYRKFRPDTFDSVKGQDGIVNTLKNQLRAKRVGHAYLFCGTRGTGKTSIAKIFAKAANCEDLQDGNPCGNCRSCKIIQSGASMNVIEIDAASNNGVDNIREIVEEVSYSPAEGAYKVYIIDEVHMLSIGAFNALLKTLEEPPEYVIFILATTEVHKIPITILSRCQRYDFKRISQETIIDRLKELAEIEEVSIEEKALKYLAKTADGSMRDALSLLDQCMAFHYKDILTYDRVLSVLGAVDTEIFSRLYGAVLGENVTEALFLVEEIVNQGREIGQFITDFIWYLRNLMLLKSDQGSEDILEMSSENLVKLREEAKDANLNRIMRDIGVFSELSGQMRYATQKRILLEMCLIRLIKPQMDGDVSALEQRVSSLENKVENGMVVRTQNNVDEIQEARLTVKKEIPKAIPEDIKEVVANWKKIIQNVSAPLMKQFLRSARLSLGGENRLMMVLEDGTPYDYFVKEPAHIEELEQTIASTIEKEVKVQVQSLDVKEKFETSYFDLTDVIKMDLEYED